MALLGLSPGLLMGIFAPMPTETDRLFAILGFSFITVPAFFYVYWTIREGVNPVV
jgi:hypothetical protein